MPIRQIDYGTAEYHQMVRLRYELLRKPLRLTYSEDYLEKEKDDILIAAFDEHKILGCCILTHIDKETIRLRQMAVLNKLHGMGVGTSLLNYAENVARDKGYRKLIMHAREAARGFYEKTGYHINGDRFTEVGIPHFPMEKRLR